MPQRFWEWGGGRGGVPPAHTRPITPVTNPLDDPRIRAILQWAIVREYELQTGQTPWNNNRGNVLRENNTRVTVTPEFPLWAEQAPQNIPGAHPASAQKADPLDRHKQELLNGVADTRTKLLNSYFFLIFIIVLLHFLTYSRQQNCSHVFQFQQDHLILALINIQNSWKYHRTCSNIML